MNLCPTKNYWILVLSLCGVSFMHATQGEAAWTSELKSSPQPELKRDSDEDLKQSLGLGRSSKRTDSPRTPPKILAQESKRIIHAGWYPYLGVLSGQTTSDKKSSTWILGVSWPWPKVEPRYFGEVQVQGDSNINLKALVSLDYLYESNFVLRPQWGVEHYIDARDSLAGLIHINHFKVRGNLVFEDFVQTQHPVQAVVGLGYGLNGLVLDLRIQVGF